MRCEGGDQIEPLEHEAHLGGSDVSECGVRGFRKIDLAEFDDTGGRPIERAQHLQEGGLPATRRALDGDELALADLEIDARQSADIPVLLLVLANHRLQRVDRRWR